jgi:phosphoadenosine phosphosulfate reductase
MDPYGTLFEGATAQEILSAGVAAAAGPVSIACSFSMEDVILLDLAARGNLSLGVFAIDTGRLNEETLEVADAVRERYGISIDWLFPRREDVERLERENGLHSFRLSLENRQECCRIRKVEPLSRALSGLAGWVTGLRREQAPSRADLRPVERDGLNGGIVKINPLLAWTEADVVGYTERERLPVNRLYRQRYRSIGCAPCTRAVAPGEPERAGRWWWEDPDHKECGLHRR